MKPNGTTFEEWRKTWTPHLPPSAIPVETCMRVAYMAGVEATVRHFEPMDRLLRAFQAWAAPIGYEAMSGFLDQKRAIEEAIEKADSDQ